MVKSNSTNNMPKGTTITFGFWVYTTNGSGGYTSRLIAPEETKTLGGEQVADTPSKLGEKFSNQGPSALDSESAGNVPAPIRQGELVKPEVTSDFENFHFFRNSQKISGLPQVAQMPQGR